MVLFNAVNFHLFVEILSPTSCRQQCEKAEKANSDCCFHVGWFDSGCCPAYICPKVAVYNCTTPRKPLCWQVGARVYGYAGVDVSTLYKKNNFFTWAVLCEKKTRRKLIWPFWYSRLHRKGRYLGPRCNWWKNFRLVFDNYQIHVQLFGREWKNGHILKKCKM